MTLHTPEIKVVKLQSPSKISTPEKMADPTQQTTITNATQALTSMRTIMEALILAGLIYIISNITQQGKDLVQLKTSSDYIAKSVDKIPNLESRVTLIEVTATNNSRRISDLETLQKAK